jgi:hypothetical protein
MTTRALAGKKKSQASALGNLALALIQQRKLDEAASAMHRTIPGTPPLRLRSWLKGARARVHRA